MPIHGFVDSKQKFYMNENGRKNGYGRNMDQVYPTLYPIVLGVLPDP